MKEPVYYFIMCDLNQVGKMEDYTYYIFEKERGWIPDSNHLLSDRLMGYDGFMIGCINMLSNVDKITEKEANMIINL